MATSDERRLLACSFCSKNEHQVRKLVAGPSVYICDECIALASGIIERSDAEDHQRGWQKLWGAIRRRFDPRAASRVALPG